MGLVCDEVDFCDFVNREDIDSNLDSVIFQYIFFNNFYGNIIFLFSKNVGLCRCTVFSVFSGFYTKFSLPVNSKKNKLLVNENLGKFGFDIYSIMLFLNKCNLF